MKQIVFGAVALIYSAASMAGVFNAAFEEGNPDLYSGVDDSNNLPAMQAKADDSYGSQQLSDAVDEHLNTGQKGSNDGYGSILIDIGHPLDW